MKFIDCDCLAGRGKAPPADGTLVEAADVLAEMDRLEIDRALVRHRLCSEYEPRLGNAACLEEIDDSAGRLMRVKMVLPEGERPDFDPAAAIAGLHAEGFHAAWIDPSIEHGPYSLAPWSAGAMLAALEERRIPTLVELNRILPDELYAALQAHPDLPVILLRMPREGRHRVVWPLADACANLYVCLSPTVAILDGLTDLCGRIGAERIVWGSGFPIAEGGAALTNLTYSGISRSEQEQIASGNIERLLKGVRHG